MNKVQHVAKLAWSALLVSTLIMGGWNKEKSFIGFIIVISSWVAIRIINEAFLAAMALASSKDPPPDDPTNGSGWTKDN